MWIVITPHGGLYQDIIDPLVARGARVCPLTSTDMTPGKVGFSGKLGTLREMLNPRLFGLRGAWKKDDNVLVVGWLLLPILFLIRVGWLHKPRRLVSLGCFIHHQGIRRLINAYYRLMGFSGLGFVAFSRGEWRSLVEGARIPPNAVLLHLWRQDLYGRLNVDEIRNDSYIFSGGYSNRDYELLVPVLEQVGLPAIIVASMRNEIPATTSHDIRVLRDIDEFEFEKLLAHSRLVVLPLKSTGEACGQSVLLRVMRNHKPLIISRHESVEDYLGSGYPGFVPPGDPDALRQAITRVLTDPIYEQSLCHEVKLADSRLGAMPRPGDEVCEWLLGTE